MRKTIEPKHDDLFTQAEANYLIRRRNGQIVPLLNVTWTLRLHCKGTLCNAGVDCSVK